VSRFWRVRADCNDVAGVPFNPIQQTGRSEAMAFSRTRRKTRDLHAQVAQLQRQVELLTRDRITPAVTNVAGTAADVVERATGVVRDQSALVSDQVREHLVSAILLAAALGWLAARAIPR
jgi:hypothetical protein